MTTPTEVGKRLNHIGVYMLFPLKIVMKERLLFTFIFVVDIILTGIRMLDVL